MSEIQEPTLFNFVCDECGHTGHVYSPDDAKSSIAVVDCPECGAPGFAFSTMLSHERLVALKEEMLASLQTTYRSEMTEADVDAMSDIALEVGLAHLRMTNEQYIRASDFRYPYPYWRRTTQ